MDYKNSNKQSDRESKFDRQKTKIKKIIKFSRASICIFFYSFFIIYTQDPFLIFLIISLVLGLIPRQRKNDSAACSTSIPVPSDKYSAPSF